MSANTQARSSNVFGRTVIVAAAAGLVGLVLTLVVAAVVMLGAVRAPAPLTIDQSTQLEPGYEDFGLRHPRPAQWSGIEPGYQDFGQRHPRPATQLEPGYIDYGRR